MKDISGQDGITPDDLHKLFVSSHGGMTPDDFAKAVRDKSINEEIAVCYDNWNESLGEAVWVAITKHLLKQGYNKSLVEESINNSIIKIGL